MIDKELTGRIIHAAYVVHGILKFGFLESVYAKALKRELASLGLKCESEKPLDVYYKGEVVGHFVADMVVEDTIIIELKAVKALKEEQMPWLQGWAPNSGKEVLNTYQFNGIPFLILLDKKGNIYRKYLRDEKIKQAIEDCLAGK